MREIVRHHYENAQSVMYFLYLARWTAFSFRTIQFDSKNSILMTCTTKIPAYDCHAGNFNWRIRIQQAEKSLLSWRQYLRNRKHVPCFYRVTQTRVEVWENEKCCGNTRRRRVFPQLFRVLPNFHDGLYNSIETRRTCFLFLLENNATRKWKTTC